MQSLNKEDKIYRKTQGICILCGKKVHKPRSNINAHTQMKGRRSFTIEHYFPKAIHKWIQQPHLKSHIEHLNNLFIVHRKCNMKKDSQIPKMKDIRKLYVSPIIQEQLTMLYRTLYDGIVAYRAIKQSAWDRQQRVCFLCHNQIMIHQATLRRFDNKLERSRDNAICVCQTCNTKKEKMLNTVLFDSESANFTNNSFSNLLKLQQVV